jgi:hypothetical protein
LQDAKEPKKVVSSSESGACKGVGDFDALGVDAGEGSGVDPEGLCTKSHMTQYAAFWVTVIESLIQTSLAIANRSDATCEQDSPSPAIQLQWAATIFPPSSATTHGVRGFSLILCEWFTCMM